MPYCAPWWLPGGHLQTIYPYFALRRAPPRLRRVRFDTPDGDFVDFDWLDGPSDVPVVVLFHGLEGGSCSHYAAALLHALALRGWRALVPHFRGCSGEPNRLARAYHSGDADEIDWMLRTARGATAGPLLAVGVSLGGNALLKWLARSGGKAGEIVRAAAAVSAPMDLMAAGKLLSRGWNTIYGLHFLRTLKHKARGKSSQYPNLFSRERIVRARTLYAFDDAYTAPAHGFAGVEDYWTRASSGPDLSRITLPTLLIHARNDPFLPGRYLPDAAALPKTIECDFPDTGGHAGFVTGRFPGSLEWLPQRLLDFFLARLAIGRVG
ncbi:MAG TPA: alpha/beta fold hydrolase [Burkholderiales bacterium]|nr:alpha/beta fold hydrolase [Burkholderiales bacterium]